MRLFWFVPGTTLQYLLLANYGTTHTDFIFLNQPDMEFTLQVPVLLNHTEPSVTHLLKFYIIFQCLFACLASLIQFFNKMRKWSDMANLNQEFRDKVDRLERNFAVSTVIFKKFQPIFLDIFRDPAMDMPRQQRNKKQRWGLRLVKAR